MKLVGTMAFVVLLALLLAPAGHGARHRARQRLGPVRVLRSPQAERAPKSVRAMPGRLAGK